MRGRIIIANFIGILVVAALILGGVYYYNQNATYIKTDDAHVTGDIMQVAAPATGTLAAWNVKEGGTLTKSSELGTVSNGTTMVNITAPNDGTIIKNQAKAGQPVQPGQTLAQIVDMKSLYVIANVDETEIKNIENGANVDVTVDGDSGSTLKGKIEEIGHATNSVFSLLPATNTTGNYTKVTQKIPVKIAISNYSDTVLPGMNAEVKITKK